jgi:RNA polymerase sigma-70 factor (ECF subfamily)
MTEKDKNSRITAEIFNQFKAGDINALQHLFSVYFMRLNDFAAHVIKDNEISQDIVMEVFEKVWENRDKIENTNIEGYLYKLVRNRCIDFIKHQKVMHHQMQEVQDSLQYEEMYRIDFVGNQPYILIEEELKAKIENNILSLPDHCREVFILSRVNGLKNREIAEKLNINIKNVERHLHRAFQSFRRNFADEVPIMIIILIIKNIINK